MDDLIPLLLARRRGVLKKYLLEEALACEGEGAPEAE